MSQLAVSKNNSTIVTLGAGASFVGQKDIVTSYQEIDINLAGGPPNATGTLHADFSPNGNDWDITIPFVLDDLYAPPISLRIVLPFFRVRYVNGPTPLDNLRITTVFHRTSAIRLTRFLYQEIDANEPVEIVRIGKSVLPDGAATETTLSAVNNKLANTLSVNQIVNTIKTLYDIQDTVAYIGTAPQGSDASAAVWTIKKTSFDGAGNPTIQVTSGPNAVWDNRVSESYS